MYNHLEATLHDAFWSDETTDGIPAELPLLENFLQSYPGTALELGCGSGRLLLPLLKKGYLIEGLDNSPEMLDLCREQTSSTVIHQASLEDFHTGSLYGAITIPAFTLQLISPENTAAVLSNIYHHLHPGGGLYFTTFIPWAEITAELTPGEWYLDHETKLLDGNTARCHTRFQIKRLSQELTREHQYKILTPPDKVLEKSSSTQKLTWFWPREMKAILREAGFSIQTIIGDFNAHAPCDENSQILTIIATRSQ